MTVIATDRAAGAVLAREPPKAPTDTEAHEQMSAAKQEQQAPAAAAASGDTNLRFHVDEDSGKTVVAWVDEAGKVLKQMPTEEALAVAKAIDRYQGVFLNRKA